MDFSSVCSFCSVGRCITLSTDQRKRNSRSRHQQKKKLFTVTTAITHVFAQQALSSRSSMQYLFLLSFLIQMYTANFMIHIAPYQNTHKHKIGRLSVNLTSRFYIANNVVCYYWVDGQKRKLWSKQVLFGKEPYNSFFLLWLSPATARNQQNL